MVCFHLIYLKLERVRILQFQSYLLKNPYIRYLVANGEYDFGSPIPLSIGLNEKTVSSVSFDRTVKFQFSTGDIKFDAITLNGNDIYDNTIEIYGVIGEDPDTQGAGCNSIDCWDTEGSWAWKDNTSGNNNTWVYGEVNCTSGSVYTQTSNCPFPLAVNSCSTSEPCDSVILIFDTVTTTIFDTVTTYIFDTIAVTDTLYIDLSFVSSTIINNSNILVYPNPSYDYVIIENEFYNLTSEYAIEIVNISGQVVHTSSLDSTTLQISVSDIGESGVYLIHIKDGSNIVVTKHLVILN